MAYVAIWEFTVGPDAPAFERMYGPHGAWVAFFRRAPEYLGTALLRDEADASRYLTIDRWASRAAYLAFRQANAERYEALDAAGESLTDGERFLGAFTSDDGAPA
jgi:heme-degrading monooxygenase HmoA